MNDSAPLLQIEHVAKRYGERADAPFVLRDVSLTVYGGESLSIVGPSGCGKSTLLNIIGALDAPTTGRVTLRGNDLSRLSETQLSSVRNHEIGFIFQSHHLLPQCTLMENVLIPTLINSSAAEGATARAERLLERVGLTEHAHKRPGSLSGGQRQRGAVVRALINQPALLLADEPTGQLDRSSATNLIDLLMELNSEEGVALIVVTHDMGAARRMARTYELLDGRLSDASRSAAATTGVRS